MSTKAMAEAPGAPPKHLKKKTMIKDNVGTVRTTSFLLPADQHVYGKGLTKDEEGAGNVMSLWVSSTPSDPKESQRSFVKTNQQALKEGCITAKAQRAFANDHRDIRFKAPTLNANKGPAKPPYMGPYGVPSSGQDESIRGLIEAGYTSFNHDDADYPDFSGQVKKGRVCKPRPTKASIGHDVRSKEPVVEKEAFKMKKFQNVESQLSNQ